MKPMIALCGNSSVGKTTAIMRVAHELKARGVQATVAFDLIRNHLIHRPIMDSPEGRLFVLYEQLRAEYVHLLRDDSQVVLLDRCVLDRYAALERDWIREGWHDPTLLRYRDLVLTEATKYAVVIHLETAGTVYQRDGYRQDDTGMREEVEQNFRSILDRCRVSGVRVVDVGGADFEERMRKILEVTYQVLGLEGAGR